MAWSKRRHFAASPSLPRTNPKLSRPITSIISRLDAHSRHVPHTSKSMYAAVFAANSVYATTQRGDSVSISSHMRYDNTVGNSAMHSRGISIRLQYSVNRAKARRNNPNPSPNLSRH